MLIAVEVLTNNLCGDLSVQRLCTSLNTNFCFQVDNTEEIRNIMLETPASLLLCIADSIDKSYL